jgi:hypothetical protein
VKQVSALRNILAAKPIRVFLVAAMVVPGSLLAASPAASARVGLHLCETFGHNYCVGAPTINLYDPVIETTGGRLLNFIPSSGGGEKIAFSADITKCVAAANNGHDVVVHPCDGSGTVWIEHQCPATTCFENNKFATLYLSGRDSLGSQYQIKIRGAAGWDQQFSAGT